MKLDACRKRRELHVVYNGECSLGKSVADLLASVDGVDAGGSSIPFISIIRRFLLSSVAFF